jgi:hypothetical protein
MNFPVRRVETMPRTTRSGTAAVGASARSTRRQAVKRTVLGAVNDDPSEGQDPDPTAAGAAAILDPSSNKQKAVEIPTTGIDGTSRTQIHLLLQDLEAEVQSRIDGIAERAAQGVEEQREAAFLGGIRLDRTVKKMTIGDFNAKYGCDVVGKVMAEAKSQHSAVVEAGKKRIRPGDFASSANAAGGGFAMATPAHKSKGGFSQVPGTILRTVRKGEAVL